MTASAILASTTSTDPRMIYESGEGGGMPFDVGWGLAKRSRVEELAGFCYWIGRHGILEIQSKTLVFWYDPFHRYLD